MNFIAASWNSGAMSTSSDEPPPGASPSPASISLRMSWMPSSPDSAMAPSRTSFAPV